jgi:hypothetical protein
MTTRENNGLPFSYIVEPPYDAAMTESIELVELEF